MDEPAENDVLTHLSNKNTWMRLVYMILYGIVFEIGKFVTFLVALVQFLFVLFSGQPQPQLRRFGFSLAEFYRQIVEFQTFRSEDKPYPWMPWPQPAAGKPKAEPAAKPAKAKEAAAANEQPAASEPAASETAKPAKRKGGRRKKAPEPVDPTDENAPSA